MKINQVLEDHYSSMKPGKRIDQEKQDRDLGIGHDWELRPGDTQPTYIGDLANHPDLQPHTDFITDIPPAGIGGEGPMIGDKPKSNHYIDKLKDLGGWYLDSVIDAGKSIGRGVKDQVTGLKDFGKRRWNTFKQDVVNDDVNRMRKLAGLNEKDEMEDVWAYSPQGSSDIVARVLKTDYGFQVFVRGPHGWIAQGQPHMSQEEAQEDAMSFFEAIDTLDVDNLNEEQFLEVVSVLELHDEALTEEQLNELWPAVAAGVGAGLGMWGIEQASKPKEEQTWYKLWKKFGPKKKEEKEVVAKESEELNEVLPLVVGGAAALGAGYAGYKWLKGLKDKVKDRKDTHKSKIDQALKDSVEPQPWWNDMDSTLQEMKAEMLSIPKKK